MFTAVAGVWEPERLGSMRLFTSTGCLDSNLEPGRKLQSLVRVEPFPATPDPLNRDSLFAFLEQLDNEVTEGGPGGEWVWADGDPVFQCTTSARRVADTFGGRVVGYFSDDNPTAEIGKDEDGHDFAFIAERFLVDYWGAYVVGEIDRPVFDLADPADREIISRLYGPREAWRTVEQDLAQEVP